jgi:hypothetical protein
MHETSAGYRLALCAAAGAALLAGPGPGARAAEWDADAGPVLARFLARPDEPVARYRARRRMEVQAMGREAWLSVRVALEAGRFTWDVEAEGGAKALREKSLIRLLEAEAEAHASGAVARSGLTADNYAIEAAGRDADGLVRLRARARRREPVLLDGFFLVTPGAADLVRVEGRLARGPSFWAPKVDVLREFARVGGHRVVVRSESRAKLRLLGESRIVVRYEYETIDGDVVAPAPVVASLTPGRREP